MFDGYRQDFDEDRSPGGAPTGAGGQKAAYAPVVTDPLALLQSVELKLAHSDARLQRQISHIESRVTALEAAVASVAGGPRKGVRDVERQLQALAERLDKLEANCG